MKLLIDIDEDRYNRIIEHFDTFSVAMKYWGVEAIKNGKRLPIGYENSNTNILDKIILEIAEEKNLMSYNEALYNYQCGLNEALEIINKYKEGGQND